VGSEILRVPEAHLHEVIWVIRCGLKRAPREIVSREVREALARWCAEEEAYLRRLSGADETDEEKRAADERGQQADARCTCSHTLRQHKDRRAGGKCWACERCHGFKTP